jgi:hypothetical protein
MARTFKIQMTIEELWVVDFFEKEVGKEVGPCIMYNKETCLEISL